MRSICSGTRVPAVAIAMAMALIACGGGGGGSGGSGEEDVGLRLVATDAPFPFDDVLTATVVVERIEIRPAGGGFETLIDFPGGRELDLVKLRNGTVDVLYEGNPGPGDYDAFRIIVEAKLISILDGGVQKDFTNFKVPSGEQTGVKVFLDEPISVVTSLTTDLVLDFDLSRSFVVQGNPATPAGIKGFHFKPVVRAINASTAGSLTFLVKSDNGTPGDTTDDFFVNGADYQVLDTSSSPPAVLASGATGTDPADSSVDGFALHPAIPAGDFDLQVSVANHDLHSQPVTITVANLTDLGEITLAATPGMVQGTVITELTTTTGTTLGFVVEGAAAEAAPEGIPSVSGTDTTDTFGAYAISPLAFGSYDVTIRKAGYEDGTAVADAWIFGSGPATVTNFTLIPKTADVTGTLRNEIGTLLPGAVVRATIFYDGATEVLAEAITDGLGAYTLTGLPTGNYEIQATHAGLAGSATLDHVGGGGASVVDLRLL